MASDSSFYSEYFSEPPTYSPYPPSIKQRRLFRRRELKFVYFRRHCPYRSGLYWTEKDEGSNELRLFGYTSRECFALSVFDAEFFEAEILQHVDAVEIKHMGRGYRLTNQYLHSVPYLLEAEEVYRYLTSYQSTYTSTDTAAPGLTASTVTTMYEVLQNNSIVMYPTPRVEGEENKILNETKNMLSKEFEQFQQNFPPGSIITTDSIVAHKSSPCFNWGEEVEILGYGEDSNGGYVSTKSLVSGSVISKCHCNFYGAVISIKKPNQKTMSQNNDDIPKILSVMERISATAEDKTLIKAGYLEGGELTQKAKDMISVLQYQVFKAQLVTAAQEELDEVKNDK